MKRFVLGLLGALLLLGTLAVPSLAHTVGFTKVDGVVYAVNHDRRLVGPGRFQGLTQTQVAAHLAQRRQAAVAPASGRGARVVAFALAQRGKPYRWGATGPSGYDCSGLTLAAYRAAGKAIPRTSGEQRAAGRVVPRSQAQPGDLIWRPGHIAVYLGGGKQVAARKAGTVIVVQPAMAGGTYLRF